MTKTCPNCNNNIPEADHICSFCNYNYKAAEIIATKPKDPEYTIEKRNVFRCPFCSKPISEYHEKCPFCASDLIIHDFVTTDIGRLQSKLIQQQTISCPHCNENVPGGRKRCPKCNKLIEAGEQTEKRAMDDFESLRVLIDQPDDDLAKTDEEAAEDEQKPDIDIATRIDDVESLEHHEAFFPPACIEPGLSELDTSVQTRIQALSPEEAPKAILSLLDEDVCYYLIAGSNLFLGRQTDVCHVPAILFPEQANRKRNTNVSRKHCQIFIRNNRVFVKDLSRNGTFIFKEPIPQNQDVPLANNDEIRISHVLRLKVQIFTDGKQVLGVLLHRKRNTTGERYILAAGAIPYGNNSALPINLSDGPALCGSLYYNPELNSWCLKIPDSSKPSTTTDQVLEPVQELIHGTNILWFSAVV
ncbi:FHA domain-containing protein [candidate division CSSED10-310 bacterium]|uniref:FHA domain-containing protein n=1 Tax=candidate division CSSED10-310 bacterium TaxID=2855610 RepID=A0ABV6Z173_UNCC1